MLRATSHRVVLLSEPRCSYVVFSFATENLAPSPFLEYHLVGQQAFLLRRVKGALDVEIDFQLFEE